MTTTEGAKVAIKTYFSERASATPLDQALFVSKWKRELLGMIDTLAKKTDVILPVIVGETKQAIELFTTHKDHGATHSFYVYEGMRFLAEKEGLKIDDSTLQAAAVLHDIAQLLPNKNPQTGEILTKDQRLSHPEIMARAVLQFGEALNIQEKDTREIMAAIRHHDDTYTSEKYGHMRPLGNLLADSDKLFGGGMSRDPKDMAHDAIVRNQQGADNPQGWYLLRDDLTPEQRNNWKYGDRWIGDRVSAVRKDIFKTEFYTESGKQISEQRRSIFIQQAKIAYGAEYDATQEALKNWRLSKAKKVSVIVSLVGKNPNGNDPQVEHVEQNEAIDNVVDRAYKKDLGVKTREGFPATRGWKIQISIDGSIPIILDPSIARFSTKEEFLGKMIEAFTS